VTPAVFYFGCQIKVFLECVFKAALLRSRIDKSFALADLEADDGIVVVGSFFYHVVRIVTDSGVRSAFKLFWRSFGCVPSRFLLCSMLFLVPMNGWVVCAGLDA
jgi:hypothetical protein